MVHERRPEILIVDDRREVAATLVALFHDKAADVMVALSGRAGLRQAQEGQPDVVLIEEHLAGSQDVCRRLRRNPVTAHIPVIFLTEPVRDGQRTQLLARGAADCLARSLASPTFMAHVFAHVPFQRGSRLLHLQEQSGLTSMHMWRCSPQWQIATTVIALLQEAQDNGASVDLTAALGFKAAALDALFHAQFGMPVAAFDVLVRLSRARARLSGSALSLDAVAAAAGYTEETQFQADFAQRYGVSPQDYRRLCAEDARQA